MDQYGITASGAYVRVASAGPVKKNYDTNKFDCTYGISIYANKTEADKRGADKAPSGRTIPLTALDRGKISVDDPAKADFYALIYEDIEKSLKALSAESIEKV
jgi:hypothetical protein